MSILWEHNKRKKRSKEVPSLKSTQEVLIFPVGTKGDE